MLPKQARQQILPFKSLVEDEMADMCESIPKSDLVDLCNKTGNQPFDFWTKCRMTCNKIMGEKVDYTGKLKSYSIAQIETQIATS